MTTIDSWLGKAEIRVFIDFRPKMIFFLTYKYSSVNKPAQKRSISCRPDQHGDQVRSGFCNSIIN
jgi:hypothetical protein